MPEPRELTFTYIPGVTPGKWIHRWEERMPGVPLHPVQVGAAQQLEELRAGNADLAFVRLPVDRTGLHVIPLYAEQPVVVAGKDHPVAVFEELDVTDLADEYLLQDPDDFPAWRDISTQIREGTRKPLPTMRSLDDALDLVEAGIGILILPMSVARHFRRKELSHRPVHGLPETSIALAWPQPAAGGEDYPVIDEFIGVVRGRSARSSRQPSVQAKQDAAPKKERTTAKRAGGAKTAGSAKAAGGSKRAGAGRTGGSKSRSHKGRRR